MSDVYAVHAFDINTNTRIAILPASGLTYDTRLNDVGGIGFSLALGDPRVSAAASPFLGYYGRPVALYVDRDGSISWGGYTTTWAYTHSTRVLSIGGKEWLGIWAQRLAAKIYDALTYPNGVDPAALIAAAVMDAQNTTLCGPGSNLGISISGGSSSLPPVSPSYTAQAFVATIIADQVAAMTPGSGGLDVWTECYWSTTSGAPRVILHISSPRAGRIGNTGLVLELSRALEWSWATDTSQAATLLSAYGGGTTGPTQPYVAAPAPGVPVGGLGQSPRLDKVIQHSNILAQSALVPVAAGEAQLSAPPMVTPQVTIPTADPRMPLGSWQIGDDVRVRAEPDAFFRTGYDQTWRIVQHAVTVPDEGVPTVALTLNPPPIY